MFTSHITDPVNTFVPADTAIYLCTNELSVNLLIDPTASQLLGSLVITWSNKTTVDPTSCHEIKRTNQIFYSPFGFSTTSLELQVPPPLLSVLHDGQLSFWIYRVVVHLSPKTQTYNSI